MVIMESDFGEYTGKSKITKRGKTRVTVRVSEGN